MSATRQWHRLLQVVVRRTYLLAFALMPLGVDAQIPNYFQILSDAINSLPPPQHASGSQLAPDAMAPEPGEFLPPSIFSAPLPSGSGARALGLAGAFTALADDATAASWNPAGLVQLERPEASFMLRYSAEQDRHRTTTSDFVAGEDDFDSSGLNYLSVVFPFHFSPFRRNVVVSLNHQEAYDFTQSFTAKATLEGRETFRVREEAAIDERAEIQRTVLAPADGVTYFTDYLLVVIDDRSTEARADLRQILENSQTADIEFRQDGVVSALSPAVAVEVTPRFSVGTAFNYYSIDPTQGDAIESHTRATYAGTTRSTSSTTTDRSTVGQREMYVSGLAKGAISGVLDLGAISGSPIIAPIAFQDSSSSSSRDTVAFDGVYEEFNRFENLEGFNATFGAMWTVNRLLTVGATVDLPWEADARQSQRVRNQVKTFTEDRSRQLSETTSDITAVKDVTFSFPLYWAIGSVWRWTQQCYTTFDVSRTHWSDFAFEAEGEGKINPFDGSPHGVNPIDDTWSVRAGIEYLFLLHELQSEVPLRAGVAWDQRPALDRPDDFYSVSLGSGFSIGQDPGKVIIDLAYIYTFANDIRGVVPEQASLRTDVEEHQGFVSAITHF